MNQIFIKLLKKIGKLTQHRQDKVSEWIWNACFNVYIKLTNPSFYEKMKEIGVK